MKDEGDLKVDIIIGQEVICPKGLGRVRAFERDRLGIRWVQVDTYVDNLSCKWDYCNIELIDPRK